MRKEEDLTINLNNSNTAEMLYTSNLNPWIWTNRSDLNVFLVASYGLLSCLFVYNLTIAIYNIYFHPLSHLPGPKLYAASHIPAIWSTIKGKKHLLFLELHEKYGDVVRYSPRHVSFCSDTAYKEILTNKPGRGQLIKDPDVYNNIGSGQVQSILSTPSDADHSRYRRLLAHGFSEKALREQEPLLLQYVDLLIRRLHEHAKDGPQDMVAWFNWATFDLIGDLTFNESFDCLEKSTYHPWIEFVFGNVKAATTVSALKLLPLINFVLMLLFRKTIVEKGEQNAAFTRKKVAHRLASQTDRVDFMGYVLNHKSKETEMSKEEIEATSSILVLAGSETTATLLSGVTYLLLKNPSVLACLTTEIRGKFANEDEINILEEAMRVFPPVPIGSVRKIPPQGDTIMGYKLSGGTTVLNSNYSAFRSSRNWKDPDSFIPERWLGDPLYENDTKGALQPFSMGPRNCIGKNLAYAEMRIILARFIWNFDIELMESSKSWMENMKVYSLWEKPRLMVKLTPRQR